MGEWSLDHIPTRHEPSESGPSVRRILLILPWAQCSLQAQRCFIKTLATCIQHWSKLSKCMRKQAASLDAIPEQVAHVLASCHRAGRSRLLPCAGAIHQVAWRHPGCRSPCGGHCGFFGGALRKRLHGPHRPATIPAGRLHPGSPLAGAICQTLGHNQGTEGPALDHSSLLVMPSCMFKDLSSAAY